MSFLIAVASLAVEHRLYGAQASVVVAPGLWSTGSLVVVHGLSGSVVCGIFLDPRIEPTSPALSGGVFTTEPPGKPNVELLTFNYIYLEI